MLGSGIKPLTHIFFLIIHPKNPTSEEKEA
jgi:hypothetical protein